MHPWVWGRMRLYGVQGTQSVRADDEPETRPNHRGGGQHSTVDHHRKASKAAHFSRKSAAPRLHRRLEKILPIEFFSTAFYSLSSRQCMAIKYGDDCTLSAAVRAELIKEARMSASPQSTQLPVARMLRPQTAAERYILTTDVTIAGGVKLTADPCPTVSALPATVTTPLLAICCWASSVVTARVKLH